MHSLYYQKTGAIKQSTEIAIDSRFSCCSSGVFATLGGSSDRLTPVQLVTHIALPVFCLATALLQLFARIRPLQRQAMLADKQSLLQTGGVTTAH